MNITPSLIYWISRLDALHITFCIGGVLLAILIGISVFGYFIARSEDEEDATKAIISFQKYAFPVFIICIFCSILIPTSKEMAAVIVIPKIANSERIQNIGDGIYNLALEWMEELSPKHGENK